MEVNERSFGILIAYLIPGWLVLLGLSYCNSTVADWLSGTIENSPSVAGFLYSTLASIGLGVFVSTLRWITIDRLVHRSGVRRSSPGFTKLTESHQAMTILVDGHYRYYQFHANLCVALPIAAFLKWICGSFSIAEPIVLIAVLAVLFVGAQDTLRKYYARSSDVLAVD